MGLRDFIDCFCCSHFNEMSKLHDRSSVGDLPLSCSVGLTGPGPGPVPHSPASTHPLSPGRRQSLSCSLNPSFATLKPHSNGLSYGSTVISTLAVDGWAVTFGTARRGLVPGPSLLLHPSTATSASVPTSMYPNSCLWSLNG